MKAVTLNKYGKPDALQLVDIEMPIPKEDEVLIKIDAIPVTTEDPLQRMGSWQIERFLASWNNNV